MSLINLTLILFLFSSNTFASEVCDVNIKKAFEYELLSNSSIINNSNNFDDVTKELINKGLINKTDLDDILTVKAELLKIESGIREKVAKEMNILLTNTKRQSLARVNLEVKRRLKNNPEYLQWQTQSTDSRIEMLQTLNQSQPVSRAIDFSSNANFRSSLQRVKSLEGVKAMDPQVLLESGAYPEVIYRYDHNFIKPSNSRGLPKARIVTGQDGRRSLSSVNPTGDGSVVNHIAADNGSNRASSPFISFSDNTDIVERFGDKVIKINVRKLLKGITEGRLRDVDIITSHQLRKGAKKRLNKTLEKAGISQGTISSTIEKVQKIANNSDGQLTKQQSEEVQGLIKMLISKSKSLDVHARDLLKDRLQLDVNYLRHAITNNEVLIRGSVPEQYLILPRRLD